MKALVVDDLKNDRILLSKLLMIAGFEVLEACNGIEALEKARKEIPDIIISDVMMSGMDGFMLLRNLKKDSKTKTIPFIFYTATYSSEEDKELGLSLQASRYLIKPVEPMEIIAHIKAVINEFKVMKIPPPEPEISDQEYLGKYGQRVSLKLESKMKKLEQEIEERRKTEEELRESEENYRDLYEEAPNAYYSVGKDSSITMANRRAAQMTGFNINELIGKKVFELYENTPSGNEKAREVFNRFIKGEEISGEELKLQKKDGSSMWVALSLHHVKDADGNVIASRSIAVDINERKEAENLRIEKERLEYASKAKSEFLASMSHELRTPLNSILGFSELMKQGIAGKLNEKQTHYIENILTSGKFLLNLINDILDLSKVEAGKIELVIERTSLPLILEETTTLIKERAARRNVNIIKELSPELEFIEVDKQRFKQVLFNLIDNAIKFSRPQGGPITITTKKAGDNVEISVTDKGIGIKAEDIGKLFQKFQQINPEISSKYGGTGLGLAICKQIVELHGGRIWVDSKYGEGTRFTFIFPLKEIKVDKK